MIEIVYRTSVDVVFIFIRVSWPDARWLKTPGTADQLFLESSRLVISEKYAPPKAIMVLGASMSVSCSPSAIWTLR